jgi:ribonuclease HII
MVAAAVIWPNESTWTEEIRKISASIKDSKKVSAKKRAVLFEDIKKYAVSWGIGFVEAAEIDAMGMSQTNRIAFTRALDSLSVKPERLLIDGLLGLDEGLYPEQIIEPRADGTYIAVAAASILAKEGRDRHVIEACDKEAVLEERYSIRSSKGYGTAAHCAGIREHGIHPRHRRLFLRKLLGTEIYSKCLLED